MLRRSGRRIARVSGGLVLSRGVVGVGLNNWCFGCLRNCSNWNLNTTLSTLSINFVSVSCLELVDALEALFLSLLVQLLFVLLDDGLRRLGCREEANIVNLSPSSLVDSSGGAYGSGYKPAKGRNS